MTGRVRLDPVLSGAVLSPDLLWRLEHARRPVGVWGPRACLVACGRFGAAAWQRSLTFGRA